MHELSIAVVGIRYANRDGTNRRFHLELLARGDPVELRREPRNEFDEHAVAVFTITGYCVGYVPSERAPFVAGKMAASTEIQAVFQELRSEIAVIRVRIGGGAPTLPPEQNAKPLAEPELYPDPDAGEWGA